MYSPEYIAGVIRKIYAFKNGPGEIRRLNVNAAPQTVDGYKIIKEAGIGTFQIFQETYHLPTYKKLHPTDQNPLTRTGSMAWTEPW